MFQAGLETDIDELKKSGIPAFVIALCGVLIPLIMGAVLSVIYGNNIMESIFIGVILTATSVSITVEALQDMGHLKGRVGTAILGAAIIDDILGIVLLSIMTSLGGASGFHIQAILKILIQMAAFFAISIIGGVGIKKFFEWLSTYKNPEIERHRRRVPVFALAFCLALAFLAEVFGIADITGAYLAGIILCRLPERFYIYNKIEVLSYMLITPVFFASIGLNDKHSWNDTDVDHLYDHFMCDRSDLEDRGMAVLEHCCANIRRENLYRSEQEWYAEVKLH